MPATRHHPNEAEVAGALAVVPDGSFSDADLDALPEPVTRYFRASLAEGTPLAPASLRMRGRIKAGTWLPFTARQVLSPHRGSLWSARAAGGLIVGYDRYLAGEGDMEWKALGLFPVMRAGGPDVARSGAGRAGGESIWVPAALLPRYGAAWEAEGTDSATVRFTVDDTPLAIRYRFDEGGRVSSSRFDRWGDPDGTGVSGWHPCGGEVTRHRTFGGVTIPSEGNFGWHYGTDRWSEGEFFRYEITALEPLVRRRLP